MSSHVAPDRETPPAMPRWVKIFGAIALGLILLVGILHLTGNSLGGPGNHTLHTNQSGQHP